MRQNDFLVALGLARRAGKLVYGYDAVAEAEDLKAIYFASDFSERAKGRLSKKAPAKTLPQDMATLGGALGRGPVGVVGVTDKGFAGLLDSKHQD